MHLELRALAADNLKRTFDNNAVLGNEYLNVAAAQKKMESDEGIAELASFLNDAVATCRRQNMTVGYHAHPFDFAKIHGLFAWELLFSRTRTEVNMQMDVGNCLAGNGDPIGMLQEFPGRTRTIHIKEHQEKTFESEFYRKIFDLCETTCDTKWYIVEMGGPDGDGLAIPQAALAKLRKLGK